MLKSDKLLLRAVEPKDLDYLFEAENNVQIWGLSATLIPFSKRTLEDYVYSVHDLTSQKQFRFIIELVKTDRAIGMVDLFDYDALNARAGVGIVISDDTERSKGNAFESMKMLIEYSRNVLFLNQLYCTIHASNTNSINLFQKLGFVKMGVRKEWYRIDESKWEDEIEFQLLLNSKL